MRFPVNSVRTIYNTLTVNILLHIRGQKNENILLSAKKYKRCKATLFQIYYLNSMNRSISSNISCLSNIHTLESIIIIKYLRYIE